MGYRQEHKSLPLVISESAIPWSQQAKDYIDRTMNNYMSYTKVNTNRKSQSQPFYLSTLRTNKRKFGNRYETYPDYAWNIPISFDIETSSWVSEGVKYASMYIWMLGFNGQCIYGRTWQEFKELTEYLTDNYTTTMEEPTPDEIIQGTQRLRFIIYVHNLGYEFQFIRHQLPLSEDSVFTDTIRKPMKFVTQNGLEFRDSLRLTQLSLDNSAKNLTKYIVKKMVGDLDYTKIRGSKTPLTDAEMKYCIHDVTTLNAIIKEKMEQEGNDISEIPMTNTGYVRRETRRKCYNKKYKKDYQKLMSSLTIPDMDTYELLKEAFSGGFTHANYRWTGKHIKGEIHSFDYTSSYPAVMLSEMFPMSDPREIDCEAMTTNEFMKILNKYACVFRITFQGIKRKKGVYDSYISRSKCIDITNGVYNNGRVDRADELTTTITNIDLSVILKAYDIKGYSVDKLVTWKWGYLPQPIIEATLEYYKGKTTLKGVAGSEDTYMMMKGMLNSEYGMMVMDIIRDEIGYSDEWFVEAGDKAEQLAKYNENKNDKRFTYYPWGIFITAYARRNLWTAIFEFGRDYIYSDTDSIKCINAENHMDYINRYNKKITAKIDRVLKSYNIDTNEARPKTVKGVEKQIGVWDWETKGHPYTEFKTLGAKRYLVRQDGDLHITVAGIPKEAGIQFLNKYSSPFDKFTDGMTIPADESHKLISTYIDESFDTVLKDYRGVYQKVHEESAINLEKSSYTMSMTDEYINFINMMKSESEVKA